MKYYVYLLKLSNNSVYTGSTPDLDKRIVEHNTRKCKSTRLTTPVKLIWACIFPDRLSARRFEKYLKSGLGQAFRNKHLI